MKLNDVLDKLKALKDRDTTCKGLQALRRHVARSRPAADQLLSSYFNISPALQELQAIWEVQVSAKDLKTSLELLSCVTAILHYTPSPSCDPSTRQQISHGLGELATSIIQRRLKSLYFHLSSGNRIRSNAALALLTAVSARGSNLLRELVAAFDFTHSALPKLARPPTAAIAAADAGTAAAKTEETDIPVHWLQWNSPAIGRRPSRALFVEWVATMLQVADPLLLPVLLQIRPLTSGLLNHLAFDPPGVIFGVLRLLTDKGIGPGSGVAASTRLELWSDTALSQLALIATAAPADNESTAAAGAAATGTAATGTAALQQQAEAATAGQGREPEAATGADIYVLGLEGSTEIHNNYDSSDSDQSDNGQPEQSDMEIDPARSRDVTGDSSSDGSDNRAIDSDCVDADRTPADTDRQQRQAQQLLQQQDTVGDTNQNPKHNAAATGSLGPAADSDATAAAQAAYDMLLLLLTHPSKSLVSGTTAPAAANISSVQDKNAAVTAAMAHSTDSLSATAAASSSTGLLRALRLLQRLQPGRNAAHARLLQAVAASQPYLAIELLQALPYNLEPTPTAAWLSWVAVTSSLIDAAAQAPSAFKGQMQEAIVDMDTVDESISDRVVECYTIGMYDMAVAGMLSPPDADDPAVRAALRHCFPAAVNKGLLSRGLQHQDLLVVSATLSLLQRCLGATQQLLQPLEQLAATTTAAAQAAAAAAAAIPDMSAAGKQQQQQPGWLLQHNVQLRQQYQLVMQQQQSAAAHQGQSSQCPVFSAATAAVDNCRFNAVTSAAAAAVTAAKLAAAASNWSDLLVKVRQAIRLKAPDMSVLVALTTHLQRTAAAAAGDATVAPAKETVSAAKHAGSKVANGNSDKSKEQQQQHYSPVLLLVLQESVYGVLRGYARWLPQAVADGHVDLQKLLLQGQELLATPIEVQQAALAVLTAADEAATAAGAVDQLSATATAVAASNAGTGVAVGTLMPLLKLASASPSAAVRTAAASLLSTLLTPFCGGSGGSEAATWLEQLPPLFLPEQASPVDQHTNTHMPGQAPNGVLAMISSHGSSSFRATTTAATAAAAAAHAVYDPEWVSAQLAVLNFLSEAVAAAARKPAELWELMQQALSLADTSMPNGHTAAVAPTGGRLHAAGSAAAPSLLAICVFQRLLRLLKSKKAAAIVKAAVCGYVCNVWQQLLHQQVEQLPALAVLQLLMQQEAAGWADGGNAAAADADTFIKSKQANAVLAAHQVNLAKQQSNSTIKKRKRSVTGMLEATHVDITDVQQQQPEYQPIQQWLVPAEAPTILSLYNQAVALHAATAVADSRQTAADCQLQLAVPTAGTHLDQLVDQLLDSLADLFPGNRESIGISNKPSTMNKCKHSGILLSAPQSVTAAAASRYLVTCQQLQLQLLAAPAAVVVAALQRVLRFTGQCLAGDGPFAAAANDITATAGNSSQQAANAVGKEAASVYPVTAASTGLRLLLSAATSHSLSLAALLQPQAHAATNAARPDPAVVAVFAASCPSQAGQQQHPQTWPAPAVPLPVLLQSCWDMSDLPRPSSEAITAAGLGAGITAAAAAVDAVQQVAPAVRLLSDPFWRGCILVQLQQLGADEKLQLVPVVCSSMARVAALTWGVAAGGAVRQQQQHLSQRQVQVLLTFGVQVLQSLMVVQGADSGTSEQHLLHVQQQQQQQKAHSISASKGFMGQTVGVTMPVVQAVLQHPVLRNSFLISCSATSGIAAAAAASDALTSYTTLLLVWLLRRAVPAAAHASQLNPLTSARAAQTAVRAEGVADCCLAYILKALAALQQQLEHHQAAASQRSRGIKPGNDMHSSESQVITACLQLLAALLPLTSVPSNSSSSNSRASAGMAKAKGMLQGRFWEVLHPHLTKLAAALLVVASTWQQQQWRQAHMPGDARNSVIHKGKRKRQLQLEQQQRMGDGPSKASTVPAWVQELLLVLAQLLLVLQQQQQQGQWGTATATAAQPVQPNSTEARLFNHLLDMFVQDTSSQVDACVAAALGVHTIHYDMAAAQNSAVSLGSQQVAIQQQGSGLFSVAATPEVLQACLKQPLRPVPVTIAAQLLQAGPPELLVVFRKAIGPCISAAVATAAAVTSTGAAVQTHNPGFGVAAEGKRRKHTAQQQVSNGNATAARTEPAASARRNALTLLLPAAAAYLQRTYRECIRATAAARDSSVQQQDTALQSEAGEDAVIVTFKTALLAYMQQKRHRQQQQPDQASAVSSDRGQQLHAAAACLQQFSVPVLQLCLAAAPLNSDNRGKLLQRLLPAAGYKVAPAADVLAGAWPEQQLQLAAWLIQQQSRKQEQSQQQQQQSADCLLGRAQFNQVQELAAFVNCACSSLANLYSQQPWQQQQQQDAALFQRSSLELQLIEHLNGWAGDSIADLPDHIRSSNGECKNTEPAAHSAAGQAAFGTVVASTRRLALAVLRHRFQDAAAVYCLRRLLAALLPGGQTVPEQAGSEQDQQPEGPLKDNGVPENKQQTEQPDKILPGSETADPGDSGGSGSSSGVNSSTGTNASTSSSGGDSDVSSVEHMDMDVAPGEEWTALEQQQQNGQCQVDSGSTNKKHDSSSSDGSSSRSSGSDSDSSSDATEGTASGEAGKGAAMAQANDATADAEALAAEPAAILNPAVAAAASQLLQLLASHSSFVPALLASSGQQQQQQSGQLLPLLPEAVAAVLTPLASYMPLVDAVWSCQCKTKGTAAHNNSTSNISKSSSDALGSAEHASNKHQLVLLLEVLLDLSIYFAALAPEQDQAHHEFPVSSTDSVAIRPQLLQPLLQLLQVAYGGSLSDCDRAVLRVLLLLDKLLPMEQQSTEHEQNGSGLATAAAGRPLHWPRCLFGPAARTYYEYQGMMQQQRQQQKPAAAGMEVHFKQQLLQDIHPLDPLRCALAVVAFPDLRCLNSDDEPAGGSSLLDLYYNSSASGSSSSSTDMTCWDVIACAGVSLSVAAAAYDPLALLLLSIGVLQQRLLGPEGFAACGLLGVVLRALAAEDTELRGLAYDCLDLVTAALTPEPKPHTITTNGKAQAAAAGHNHPSTMQKLLQSSKRSHQLQALLQWVTAGIKEPQQQLPAAAVVLAAEAALLLAAPASAMHGTIHHLLLRQPALDTAGLPLFSRIMAGGSGAAGLGLSGGGSSGVKGGKAGRTGRKDAGSGDGRGLRGAAAQLVEKQWLIRLLWLGLRGPQDGRLYRRKYVCEQLMALYGSVHASSSNTARSLPSIAGTPAAAALAAEAPSSCSSSSSSLDHSIRQVVRQAVQLPGLASHLIRCAGLLPWLAAEATVHLQATAASASLVAIVPGDLSADSAQLAAAAALAAANDSSNGMYIADSWALECLQQLLSDGVALNKRDQAHEVFAVYSHAAVSVLAAAFSASGTHAAAMQLQQIGVNSLLSLLDGPAQGSTDVGLYMKATVSTTAASVARILGLNIGLVHQLLHVAVLLVQAAPSLRAKRQLLQQVLQPPVMFQLQLLVAAAVQTASCSSMDAALAASSWQLVANLCVTLQR